jgi:siroheme synthase (precorrin-2 oxidase/ferrochelatase)
MTPPMRKFHISDMQIDLDTNSITNRIAVKVSEEIDEAIVKAIIQCAKEEGINDLYLLDKEFVMSAINHELERRGWK